MRILLLGINFAPEIISTAVYSHGLADWMASRGHATHVVTAKPYYPAWQVFDGWKGWYRRRAPRDNLTVVHCPLYVPRRPTGVKRILHHASFALTALPALLIGAARTRPDVVFVVAPSLIAAPAGWLAARLCGAKAWLHIQDYEVEAAFATGLVRDGGAAAAVARAFERLVLRRFDRVSSISAPMVDKLADKGIGRDRRFELPNWANLSVVRPLAAPSSYRAAFGITTPHVVLYAGNIANKQGLEILPEIARQLAGRQDLTFVVCGDGPFLPDLRRLAADLPNIRFFPLQPVDRLGELMGLASVHFLPQIAGAADLVLPSKLTNMLASGRPVLATADRGTALARAVDGCGIVVPPGDVAAICAGLAEIIDTPGRAATLGAAARERALAQWDIERILGRLHAELAALTGRDLPQAVTAAE